MKLLLLFYNLLITMLNVSVCVRVTPLPKISQEPLHYNLDFLI